MLHFCPWLGEIYVIQIQPRHHQCANCKAGNKVRFNVLILEGKTILAINGRQAEKHFLPKLRPTAKKPVFDHLLNNCDKRIFQREGNDGRDVQKDAADV